MKITLIALHYGEEGSGGARRSFLWAKGLRAAGHQVHVISPYVSGENSDDLKVPFANRGSAFLNEPPKEPGAFERLIKRHLRIWLRWPDPEITWHRNLVDLTKEHVTRCDWIITSSPPESAHVIGSELADALDAKWCVELRDNWIDGSHRPYVRGLRAIIEKILAKRWLKRADAITSVDERVLNEAKNLAPNAASAEIGHFSEPFTGDPYPLPKDTFNLVHAGGFERSDKNRNLQTLLDAIKPISERRADFHLHLMGPLTFEETKILEVTQIPITYHGWVELSISRAIQASADAVLLYASLKVSTALPGKYAEYCNLRKPIVFFGPQHVREKAARQNEFLELENLVDLPKGLQTPVETHATVENAIGALISLLQHAASPSA